MSDKKRVLQGEVVSTKMQKTITVLVSNHRKHPLYHKRLLQTKKYHVRDDEAVAKDGDLVEIIECRPLSHTVHFKLLRVVKKAGK